MTTEWTELNTLQDVAKAQADGWEIECFPPNGAGWMRWMQGVWNASWQFRARPRQPKMKTVTARCWYDSTTEKLLWSSSDMVSGCWIRIPAQDIEIEIPEGV